MTEISRVARYTNRLHVQAAILDGLCAGVLVTRDVVAQKGFGAGPIALVLLTMGPALWSSLAVLVAPYLARLDRRRIFLWSGLLGRLSLLLILFTTAPEMLIPFIAINVMVELFQVAVVPAQNTLYQSNYHASHRARLFGRAATYQGLATACTALVCGWLLDTVPGVHRAIYPVAGIAGLLSYLIFARIKLRRRTAAMLPLHQTAEPAMLVSRPAPLQGVAGTIRSVLLEDRDFRRFEVAFFLYGIGFMMLQPVFAPFLVDVMHLDYKEASLAKAVVFYLAFVVSLPVTGHLTDRLGIPWLAAATFGLLFVFSTSLVFVSSFPALLVCFVIYGFAMGGISICWNLGPTLYARGNNASIYMSIHISLVGIRALIAFPLGGLLASEFGVHAAFLGASGFFFCAILVMIKVARVEAQRQVEAAGASWTGEELTA